MTKSNASRSVLLVDPDNFTPYYVANLAHHLVLQGWRVEWLTSPSLFEPIDAPVEVESREFFFRFLKVGWGSRIPGFKSIGWLRRVAKAVLYPLDLLRLDRELSRRSPGLLHVQWALLPLLDAKFWRRWQRLGWKIVYTAHDVEFRAGTGSRLGGATRALFQVADGVFVNSKADLEASVACGSPSERTWLVPPGGPGIFSKPQSSMQDARRELGLSADQPILLFFGLIKPYKGVEVLLKSLEIIRQRLPETQLLMAGAIPGKIGSLKRKIRQTEDDGGVIWHRGYVPQDRVNSYFAASDVVVLPYLASSTSGVVPLANAAGRPVVTTAVGALPEMVRHRETGLLVDPGDELALAEAILEVLQHPLEARRMGEKGRELGEHRCWEKSAEDTGTRYEALFATS